MVLFLQKSLSIIAEALVDKRSPKQQVSYEKLVNIHQNHTTVVKFKGKLSQFSKIFNKLPTTNFNTQ